MAPFSVPTVPLPDAVKNRAGVTIKETAAYLVCSERTVHNLLNAGELEGFRIGRARRVTPASILDYIERHSDDRCAS